MLRSVVILFRLLPLVLSFARDHRRWLVAGGPVARTRDFHARRAERMVATIGALGPAFVKLAQVLAARADLVPEPYLSTLGKLHDRVPPVPAAVVRRTIEAAYGRPVEEMFRAFDWTPLAAASLGQVHRAEVAGQQVVVKVLRPGVERTVPRDLALAGLMLGVAERRWGRTGAAAGHLRGVRAAVDEFARRVGEEMDFRHEAANAVEMRERFAGRAGVAIPQVWPDLVRERVLVLEYMPGARIDALQARVAAGTLDAQALVRRVIALYMRMMLVDGFFHADPHPGNLLVQDDGTLVVLDFGMVVRVEKRLRRTLARTAFAGIQRDAPALVDGFFALGLFEPGADRATAESLVAALLEIAHAADTSSVDRMQLVADRVLATLYEFPVTLPADLVYFARTTALIEGLGVRYDAHFNAVTFAAPVALELRREIMDSLREPGEADPIPGWPALLEGALGRAAEEVTTAVAGAVRRASRGLVAVFGRLVTDVAELAEGVLDPAAAPSTTATGPTIVVPAETPVTAPAGPRVVARV
ncbi:MAG TPA: AarF/UbiB family protein [Gemmatirosa sp.]